MFFTSKIELLLKNNNVWNQRQIYLPQRHSSMIHLKEQVSSPD